MHRALPPFVLVFLGVLSGSAPAQYVSLATESFQYPTGALDQLAGGTGWAGVWYANVHASVTSPGLDAVGNKATTTISDAGSYRTLDAANWPDPSQLLNGQFGADGSILWLRFLSQRISGGDDLYGGLSLVTQLGPENMFFGSPWMTAEWGFHRPGEASVSLPGTNIDAVTQLVYRVDFGPGPERVRLWLDPASAHPSGTPDLDANVGDFQFNEIRLQSGTGGMAGTAAGYHFDAIELEFEVGELRANVQTVSAAAGGTIGLSLGLDPGTYANSFYFVLGSVSGTSPGIPLSPSVVIPLVYDPYTFVTLNSPNTAPIFQNTFGNLDANGAGVASVQIPARATVLLVGLDISHAALILHPTSISPQHATNAVSVRIVP